MSPKPGMQQMREKTSEETARALSRAGTAGSTSGWAYGFRLMGEDYPIGGGREATTRIMDAQVDWEEGIEGFGKGASERGGETGDAVDDDGSGGIGFGGGGVAPDAEAERAKGDLGGDGHGEEDG